MTTEQEAMNFWGRIEQVQKEENRQNLKLVCKKAGVSYQTIANQKSSARLPSLDTAYRLSRELNCSLDWLLSGDIEKTKNTINSVRAIATDPRKREIVEKIATLSQSELFAIEVFLNIRK